MVNIEYYNKKIYVIPDANSNNDVGSILSYLHFAEYVGGVWQVNREYVESLSEHLADISDQIVLSDSFKEFLQEFRKKESEINYKGKEGFPRVIIHSYVNRSRIMTSGYPKTKIIDACKFFLKAAVNMKTYKDGRWDGYINLFDESNRTFLTGLLGRVKEVLEKEGYPYEIVYKYDRRPPRQFDWQVDDGIVPDPDQIEAIRLGYEAGRSILKAPTGFGKTALLAKRLMAKFGVPTLFVANKKTLLDDAKEEFLNGVSGITERDIGQIKDGIFGHTKINSDMNSDDIPELDMPIIVATIQSLSAKLRDPRTRKKLRHWLNDICKFVMVDETQAVGTETWDEVLDQVYAPYRAFLSATPKRTDGATLKILAYSGPMSFYTTAEEQIEKGRLSEVEIISTVYDHKLYNKDDDSIQYAEAYSEWIVNNMDRNIRYVVMPALDMVFNEGRHVLILISRIEHGELLKDLLIQYGMKEEEVRFVYGGSKDEYRKSAIKEFRKGSFKILIGSTIFDAGVNIPIISGIIMAGAGNSEITLIQRIGRGVRNADYEDILGYLPPFMLEFHNKKKAKVLDIYDANVKFFERQARNRYNTAREEFGNKRVTIVGEIQRPEKERVRKDPGAEQRLREKLDEFSEAFKTEPGKVNIDNIGSNSTNAVLEAFKKMARD